MTTKFEEFDYECPECGNYVKLKRNQENPELLEGWCEYCHLDISITEDEVEQWKDEFEQWEKENFFEK